MLSPRAAKDCSFASRPAALGRALPVSQLVAEVQREQHWPQQFQQFLAVFEGRELRQIVLDEGSEREGCAVPGAEGTSRTVASNRA